LKIAYIWFRDYVMFHNQGFNFDPQFKFKYNPNSERLFIQRNEHFVEGFFDHFPDSSASPQIFQISAIVGRNGSGKSTFLNFIKYNLVRANAGTCKETIVVIKEGQDYILYHDESISVLLDLDYPVKISVQSEETFRHRLPETSVIFYSNIFDLSNENAATQYYNLSTNYLVREDRKDRYELGMASLEGSEVSIHRFEEVYRQVLFYLDFSQGSFSNVHIQCPKFLHVAPNSLHDIEKKKFVYQEELHIINQIIEENMYTRRDEYDIPQIREDIKAQIRKRLFLCDAYKALINHFIYELSTYDHLRFGLNSPFHDRLLPNEDDLTLEELIEVVKESIKGLVDSNSLSEKDREWLEAVLEMFNLINHYAELPEYWTDQLFKVPLYEQGRHFIDTFRKSFRIYPCFSFHWEGLSTGENAFLTLFGRLFTLADQQRNYDNLELTDDIILLIDEGELYFHPEWQRLFIANLLTFLSLTFGTRTIQIILTSHSPFILSDLPCYSVSYLTPDQNGTVVANASDKGKRTFASNIHTLFADSFFMEKGLIGQLAKEKLDRYMELLVGEERPNAYEMRKLKQTIDLIGEDVIRIRLREILRERGWERSSRSFHD
jgi:AAA15 family ATPase/GTPase